MSNYWIPQHEWPALIALLDEIPGVCEDLSITLCRLDKHGSGSQIRSGEVHQPLPINMAASDAAHMLNGELAKWVRRTATTRQLDRPDRDDTLTYARWLKRWHPGLALTPDADLAPGQIRQRIRDCRRICDSPREPEPLPMDAGQEDEARALVLNANGLTTLVQAMGDRWLTKPRIKSLLKGQHIRPAAHAHGQNLYRVGDVMDAHHTITCHARDSQETA